MKSFTAFFLFPLRYHISARMRVTQPPRSLIATTTEDTAFQVYIVMPLCFQLVAGERKDVQSFLSLFCLSC